MPNAGEPLDKLELFPEGISFDDAFDRAASLMREMARLFLFNVCCGAQRIGHFDIKYNNVL